jgi:hypothetical protein
MVHQQCCVRRFLAEAPDAFGERMQRLLPFLLTVQQGQAVVFLLPALSQVIPQATEQSESTKSDSSWLAALLDKPVAFSRSPLCSAQLALENPLSSKHPLY